MELITYLNDNFLTKSALLEISKVTADDLLYFQQQGVMPKRSYALDLTLSCDSFFGEHSDTYELEYYAKGYVAWLGTLQSLVNIKDAYTVFKNRYMKAIGHLEMNKYEDGAKQTRVYTDAHIQQEWEHFLSGTYGLCTKSGLPEDIAEKELAILEIKALLSLPTLNSAQKLKLGGAVSQLDDASAFFAPHERHRSSRQQFINDVRREYKL